MTLPWSSGHSRHGLPCGRRGGSSLAGTSPPRWGSRAMLLASVVLVLVLASCVGTRGEISTRLASDDSAEHAETQVEPDAGTPVEMPYLQQRSIADSSPDTSGLMAVEIPERTCGNAKSNGLFVQAVNLLLLANGNRVEDLEQALDNLKTIRDAHPCTIIGSTLSAPRGIDRISIEALERQIRILKKEIPESCGCAPLQDNLHAAMEMTKDDERDDMISTIVRKLVRRNDFRCAQGLVELIESNEKRNNIARNISRARARTALRKERCCLCSGHGR